MIFMSKHYNLGATLRLQSLDISPASSSWRSSRFSSPITRRPTLAAWRWAASGRGYLAQSKLTKDPGPWTGDPGSRAVRLGPRGLGHVFGKRFVVD